MAVFRFVSSVSFIEIVKTIKIMFKTLDFSLKFINRVDLYTKQFQTYEMLVFLREE